MSGNADFKKRAAHADIHKVRVEYQPRAIFDPHRDVADDALAPPMLHRCAPLDSRSLIKLPSLVELSGTMVSIDPRVADTLV